MAFLPPSPSLITQIHNPHCPRRRLRPTRFPLACAASPPEVPTSLSQTLFLASSSITSALATSQTRLRVTALIPGLNPQIEDTVPYSIQTLFRLAHGLVTETPILASLPDISLLFPSAGTAASAANLYATECPTENVRTASFFIRDAVEGRVSQSANIIISPISSRGDRVMNDLDKIITEAPGAIWILLNPQLDVDRAAVGMKESARRADLIKHFPLVFYFRNLFEIKRPKLIAVERGALLFMYPGPWRLFALNDGYQLLKELDHMPGVDIITTEIKRARRRLPAKVNPQMDQEFFRVLLLCGCLFLAVLGAFRVAGKTDF